MKNSVSELTLRSLSSGNDDLKGTVIITVANGDDSATNTHPYIV